MLAMPSDSECFGISAAEAAACGVPVVLTPQCGIAEHIAKEQAGIVVQQKADKIAQGIKDLLADEKLRLTMGQNGQRLIENEFRWKKAAKGTDELLSSL